MRTLYLDCSMGAAGDMLGAALLELLPDREAFLEKLNGLGLPGVRYTLEPAVKCGVTGSHLTVTVEGEQERDHSEHHHHHAHNDLHSITHLVADHLRLPEAVKDHVLQVFRSIAQAESRVHGVPMEQIHFHEVGTMDAIADVTAVCLLMEELKPEQVVASPVHVGSGQVRCAHGILPVPAPATALLLQGVPIYGGQIQGELCTPTGAALLKHFVASFGPMPLMTVDSVGYGMGNRDFPAANCVRAMLGTTEASCEDIACISCNLDDMTPEDMGFAMERLLEAGALDVYTTPIGMKKSRPGVLLTCLCSLEDRARMEELMLRHTTTLGVRTVIAQRRIQSRRFETLQTPYGPVRVKRAGDKAKPEYEDLAQIARSQNLTLSQVRELFTHAK